MNNDRRKRIETAQTMLRDAQAIIEEVAAEEHDAYDNLPEGLQAAERGERMDQIASSLDDVVNSIEDAFDTLNDCAE